MANDLRFIGHLDCTKSLKIRIQDPGYVNKDGSSYGHYELDLAEEGWEPETYPVAVEIEGGFVKRLILGRSEHRIQDRYDECTRWLADLGVDSGQIALMNDFAFHAGWNDGEESEYRKICDLTIGCGEGVLDNQLVAACSSGYGGGQYELTKHYAGDVFVITFIEDEDDEDYYMNEPDIDEDDTYSDNILMGGLVVR